MADQHGLFWDSRGGDRKYNADSMEEWLKPFFVTGVFNGQLQVTATTGMGISVASGYCNVGGKVKLFDDATTFTLEAASAVLDRVDTVVIERNNTDRDITLKVVTGTPGEGATAPVRSDTIYQLVLAQISVATGVVGITQEDITDTRTDSELCGYVCATVDEIDFDQITAQFNSWFESFKTSSSAEIASFESVAANQFNVWFNTLRYILDGDVAGHLQNEIDVLDDKVNEFEDCETVFNADGSITSTYDDRVRQTVFNDDGSITETLLKNGEVYKVKNTIFNADGSITEEVVI